MTTLVQPRLLGLAEDIAATVRQAARSRYGPECTCQLADPTDVPWWFVPRLTAYADSLGYPVRYPPLIGGDPEIRGQTPRRVTRDPYTGTMLTIPGPIEVKASLSPSEVAHTLAHEVTHAWLTVHQPGFVISREALACHQAYGEFPAEEFIADLTSTLVNNAAGIIRPARTCYLSDREAILPGLTRDCPALAAAIADEIAANIVP